MIVKSLKTMTKTKMLKTMSKLPKMYKMLNAMSKPTKIMSNHLKLYTD